MPFIHRKFEPALPTLAPTPPKKRVTFMLFFCFAVIFYGIEFFYIGPVDGINDDYGMYSTLSGAYLGTPDAHVLFFLYPLSWILCQLYKLCSFIPWYGLFQHGVHVVCLYIIYTKTLSLINRRNDSNSLALPGITVLFTLFFVVDLNMISEAQYTTTAGLAAATALFCFIVSRMGDTTAQFLKQNIPTIILAWTAFSMRQNILYLMLPMAGMLWLSKWIIARRTGVLHIASKLLGFALILAAGMGILFSLHCIAYSDAQWADFLKINHYRERIGDFYTWPEYEECADSLTALGISEETYYYRKNGAPYIGYEMDVEDWKQMHDIARECYLARTDILSRLRGIAVGSVTVFLYQDGMQPLNLCVGVLLLITLLLILVQKNFRALLVYLFYLFGRTVSWCYVLYEGRFPKRIVQPLITVDFMILLGILLAFNLLRPEGPLYTVVVPLILLLSGLSLYSTKADIDATYHVKEKTWQELKTYCHSHPDNFYIWSYYTGTLDNYCESPFDLTQDTYNNFFYTNWGVVCNPNSKKKLALHGIEDFGKDLADSDAVYFICREDLYSDEHPVIMYFRHTYDMQCETADSFTAGGASYGVYQLVP